MHLPRLVPLVIAAATALALVPAGSATAAGVPAEAPPAYSRYHAGWELNTYDEELPRMAVKTTFEVPRVRCTTDGAAVRVDVRQDGNRDALLMEVVATCSAGEVGYRGQIGGYFSDQPLPEIHRGDLLRVATSHQTAYSKIVVENLTQEWRRSFSTLLDGVRYSTIEVSRVGTGADVVPLADFGRVRFEGATVGGQPFDAYVPSSYRIFMSDGGVLARASNSTTDGSSFSVRWVAPGP